MNIQTPNHETQPFHPPLIDLHRFRGFWCFIYFASCVPVSIDKKNPSASQAALPNRKPSSRQHRSVLPTATERRNHREKRLVRFIFFLSCLGENLLLARGPPPTASLGDSHDTCTPEVLHSDTRVDCCCLHELDYREIHSPATAPVMSKHDDVLAFRRIEEMANLRGHHRIQPELLRCLG